MPPSKKVESLPVKLVMILRHLSSRDYHLNAGHIRIYSSTREDVSLYGDRLDGKLTSSSFTTHGCLLFISSSTVFLPELNNQAYFLTIPSLISLSPYTSQMESMYIFWLHIPCIQKANYRTNFTIIGDFCRPKHN